MKLTTKFFSSIFLLSLVFSLMSCSSSTGNVGQVQSYPVTALEANWIKNGEPIEFEKELWYPEDDVEVFADPEVQPLGEYRGVQFFASKTDIRPFARIYTKFGRNQFRTFEKKAEK